MISSALPLRTALLSTILIAFLCSWTLSASEPDASIPLWRSSELNSAVAPRPVWVPATFAFDDRGDFSFDMFNEANLYMLDRFSKDSERRGRNCISLFAANPRRYHSLARAVESVDWIVDGRVTGSEPGFLFGQPGTLFTIVVNEHLTAGSVGRPEAFLMFYPIATFTGGNHSICVVPEDVKPVLPLDASSVIVIASETLVTRSGATIVMPSARHDVFWIFSEEKILPPQLLKGLPSPLNREGLTGRIRELVRKRGGASVSPPAAND